MGELIEREKIEKKEHEEKLLELREKKEESDMMVLELKGVIQTLEMENSSIVEKNKLNLMNLEYELENKMETINKLISNISEKESELLELNEKLVSKESKILEQNKKLM